jgi:hypothetical protein
MRLLTIAFITMIAGGAGMIFYIRAALRRIADKEQEQRVASEVRRMETEISNSPVWPSVSPFGRESSGIP